MLGKVIVRDDIVYLHDDPVIDPTSIAAHLKTIGDTLRTTGLKRLLVQGASQSDAIDDAALAYLTEQLARNLPPGVRVAFAHAGYAHIASLSEQVCRLLDGHGIEATSVSSQADAARWLRMRD